MIPNKLRLNSHQLRKSSIGQGSHYQRRSPRNSIVLVLDNVLDTYNIGSFFRLADALNVEKIYLCGPVVTPPNIKIHRASIGTWKWVPWEHYYNTSDCLKKLKTQGYTIYACEQTQNSVLYNKTKYQFPLAIVAGSEMDGVGESVLKVCDHTVEIPMFGVNRSLNVLVATSIIAFESIKSKS